MPCHLRKRARLAQHPAAVAKQELGSLKRMALCLLDHEQRGLVGVFEDGEHGDALDAVDGVVAPLAGGDPRAVYGKDGGKLLPRKIQRLAMLLVLR